MRNLTTAILVKNEHLPLNGLSQRSLELNEEPLHFMDILTGDGMCDDDISRQIAHHLVTSALEYQHPAAVRRCLGYSTSIDEVYPMPKLEVLKPLRTPVHVLCTMFENEASIEGTARVHEHIHSIQMSAGSWQR